MVSVMGEPVEGAHAVQEAGAVDPVVLTLIRELVAALVGAIPDVGPDAGTVELLDVEIDGVRCRCHWLARPPPAASLSPREQEIVRMVAKGHTNQAIADVLGISSWTVSTHLRRVFAKLHVNSRAAMVADVVGTEQRGAQAPIR
jgi:DNA-binding CsgD family transcriptional regulator